METLKMSASDALSLGENLRVSARKRYQGDDLRLAVAVGRFLQRENGIDDDDISASDPCLLSLRDALLEWEEYTFAGRLPVNIPRCPKPGSSKLLQTVADLLAVAGMWGVDTTYPYKTMVSAFGQGLLEIGDTIDLPGWTMGRLAELYALADDPVDEFALWVGAELSGAKRPLSWQEVLKLAFADFPQYDTQTTGTLLTAALTRLRESGAVTYTVDAAAKTSLWSESPALALTEGGDSRC